MARQRKRARFLATHPLCCFCGGREPATTIDHVPPKICFPSGLHPESTEFPACKECNEGSAKLDQVAGFITLISDFGGPGDPKHEAAFINALLGVRNNAPTAIPNIFSANPIYRIGSLLAPKPVAFQIDITPKAKRALSILSKKLTHAVYYAQKKEILDANSHYVTGCYQPQIQGMQPLTDYFNGLPNLQTLGRSNVKDTHLRMAYRWGFSANEELFGYLAQLGSGLMIWGLIATQRVETSDLRPIAGIAWTGGGDIMVSIKAALAEWTHT